MTIPAGHNAKLSMDKLCNVVETAIKLATNTPELSAPIDADATMGTPIEWDSLSFVVVFNAVAEAFDVELDDEDAIHFTSIVTIFSFLSELLSQ